MDPSTSAVTGLLDTATTDPCMIETGPPDQQTYIGHNDVISAAGQ